MESLPFGIDPATGPLSRATVAAVDDTGTVVVDRHGATDEHLPCDVLETGTRLSVKRGDTVLVWHQPAAQRGIVVGRIRGAAAVASASLDSIPETLVLEAKQSLTLRVGDGSITIREDGKILIKGKDLVSHAQRMNRIKGGAVSIN